jgi:hypothetical protein
MARCHYQVVRHKHGWAYRLERTYSRVFPTQWQAIEAARAAALKMHEPGDDTQVLVQDGPLNWRTELIICGGPAS